ncbi:MAG: GDSL-type esterase/lipase family protein [Planctomycetota bacterium]
MNTRIAAAFVSIVMIALTGCQAAKTAEAPATKVASQPAPVAWYEPEIRAFEEADRKSPPGAGQVLFVGSSSIKLWTTLAQDTKPAPVINRGFGGSKTGEVLAVFDRVVVPCKPSVIVYYCGDNDLGVDGKDAQAAANGFIEFDRRARRLWPDVQVFYIAIKPSVQRWSNWAAMKRANDMVQEHCLRTPGATYLDIVTPMLTADGRPDPTLFKEDGLHLNAKGYAIWTSVVKGAVVKAWERVKK